MRRGLSDSTCKVLRMSNKYCLQTQCQAFYVCGSSHSSSFCEGGLYNPCFIDQETEVQKYCHRESKWQNWNLNLRSVGLRSQLFILLFQFRLPLCIESAFFPPIGLLQQENHCKQRGNLHISFCIIQDVDREVGQLSLSWGHLPAVGGSKSRGKRIQMMWV